MRGLVTTLCVAALLLVAWPVAPADAALARPLAGVAPQQPAEPVDINTATAEQLQAVPGIGPTTARRIVDWRRQHGAFERLEDLLNVRGIGTKTLEQLRPYLTVGPVDPGGEGRPIAAA